jgi:hypothetical protein
MEDWGEEKRTGRLVFGAVFTKGEKCCQNWYKMPFV